MTSEIDHRCFEIKAGMAGRALETTHCSQRPAALATDFTESLSTYSRRASSSAFIFDVIVFHEADTDGQTGRESDHVPVVPDIELSVDERVRIVRETEQPAHSSEPWQLHMPSLEASDEGLS